MPGGEGQLKLRIETFWLGPSIFRCKRPVDRFLVAISRGLPLFYLLQKQGHVLTHFFLSEIITVYSSTGSIRTIPRQDNNLFTPVKEEKTGNSGTPITPKSTNIICSLRNRAVIWYFLPRFQCILPFFSIDQGIKSGRGYWDLPGAGENDARKRSHNPIRKGPGSPAPKQISGVGY